VEHGKLRALLIGFAGLALVSQAAVACGGRSTKLERERDGSGGSDRSGRGGMEARGGAAVKGGSPATGGVVTTGGTPATGGSVATGGTPNTGGTGAALTCSIDGRTYPDGATVPSSDCNRCWCASGSIACTMALCPDDCRSISTGYAGALRAAKRCDPFADERCTKTVPEALVCGCPTFVTNTAELDSIRSLWDPEACGRGVACGACPPEPSHGECSAEGECIDVPHTGTGEGCTFEYLGDWVRCEFSGWPNTVELSGATSLDDCFEACRASPRCTGVVDYFWLGEPELGCQLYESTCDAPTMPGFAEEDGGKEYRKICEQ
jgi:hypothetical protein